MNTNDAIHASAVTYEIDKIMITPRNLSGKRASISADAAYTTVTNLYHHFHKLSNDKDEIAEVCKKIGLISFELEMLYCTTDDTEAYTFNNERMHDIAKVAMEGLDELANKGDK